VPNQTFFGYVGYDPSHDQIVVAFRGSNGAKNWMANINVD